jgi:hypothetical protein
MYTRIVKMSNKHGTVAFSWGDCAYIRVIEIFKARMCRQCEKVKIFRSALLEKYNCIIDVKTNCPPAVNDIKFTRWYSLLDDI